MEVVARIGHISPFLSADYKIAKTIKALSDEENIVVGRTTVSKAIKKYKEIKKEEIHLLNGGDTEYIEGE